MSEEQISQSAPTTPVRNTQTRNSLGIPVAIVLAAALIAGAIYLKDSPRSTGNVDVQAGITAAQKGQQITPEVAPVTKDDHIRGNPNAPILIVEYSDYDCPFCRLFHDTMVKIMEEYGASEKVAWVYRHFPINELHPNASKISEASECVADLGGNTAFWKFNDALNNSRKVEFAPDGNIKSIEPTNMARMSEFAAAAGVDKTKFENCYQSGKFAEKVKADAVAATKAGAQGTPHSIIMVGDQQGVINGAQPYETVKAMIDNLIAQMEGKITE